MSQHMAQSNRHVAVCELLNETLREVYVGFTDSLWKRLPSISRGTDLRS